MQPLLGTLSRVTFTASRSLSSDSELHVHTVQPRQASPSAFFQHSLLLLPIFYSSLGIVSLLASKLNLGDMAEPQYTIFIRVPIPRRGFVDPPAVSWDTAKDDALWKILSQHGEIDWSLVADRFEVPVEFLVQQVAYLNERHQSHTLAQVRKAAAAAKGSAAQSPIPGADLAGVGHLRTPSALSIRRDVSMLRNESGTAGPAMNAPARPAISRNTSATTTVMRDGGGASPRIGNRPNPRGAGQSGGIRLSSLPTPSPAPTPRSPKLPGAEINRMDSPGPAETSSTTSSSDDESLPVQSRIIRRPPRPQQQDSSLGYHADDDDESEPAFQPRNAPSADASAHDLSSTLKLRNQEGRNPPRRTPKPFAKELNHSQTSDSSASSPAMVSRPGKSRERNSAGPSSPRRNTETRSSQENSEGTPSISSSFSDLDDASVTRSAMEEVLASRMGSTSRFGFSFRR